MLKKIYDLSNRIAVLSHIGIGISFFATANVTPNRFFFFFYINRLVMLPSTGTHLIGSFLIFLYV